jgi:hypothetical protein
MSLYDPSAVIVVCGIVLVILLVTAFIEWRWPETKDWDR